MDNPYEYDAYCLSQAQAYIQELEAKYKALAGRHAALVEAAIDVIDVLERGAPDGEMYEDCFLARLKALEALTNNQETDEDRRNETINEQP